ncbi:MAG: Flp pilus assembly protein CpaB [Candidatus Brocadiia bacterium]
MRTRLALLAAIVLGVVAAVGVRAYLTRKEEEYKGKGKQSGVVVATQTLERGHKLEATDVKEMKVPAVAVRSDDILYENVDNWIGEELTRRVSTGELLRRTDFQTRPEAEAFKVKRLRPKWRAMTIGTDQITGVAGLIIPGSYVDILVTRHLRETGMETAGNLLTQVIARRVEVLAVDSRTTPQMRAGRRSPFGEGYSSVTLLVTPREAALITFAQALGKLTLSLRHPQDDKAIQSPPITLSGFEAAVVGAESERERLLKERREAKLGPQIETE